MASFLSGLLGPAINVATNAVSADQGAQAASANSNIQATLQRAQIVRQQKEDAIKQAVAQREAQSQEILDNLNRARIGDTNQQMLQRQYEVDHPKPVAPVLGSPEYLKAEQDLAEAKAKADARYAYHAPQQNFQFMQSTDPTTGQPVYAKGNKATGDLVPTSIPGRPAAHGAGGSSQGAQVPVADMEQRYGEIADAAAALGRGDWKMTGTMQAREGLNYANTLNNAAGHPSLKDTFLSGAMNSTGAGGDDYKQYQSMMNSTRALGDDVAKVFKGRQNEQSVIREIGLSQLTPDDYGNPQVVEQKLSRLRHIIGLAKLNNPAQADISQEPAAPSHESSQDQQDWDAAVTKYGKARVLKEYGPRP